MDSDEFFNVHCKPAFKGIEKAVEKLTTAIMGNDGKGLKTEVAENKLNIDSLIETRKVIRGFTLAIIVALIVQFVIMGIAFFRG
jgi:hypothetical protein